MINARIQQLRTWMEQRGIDVLVVPTMDPHNSEYVPEHWKCRQWITGFTGSAGTAIITSAALEAAGFGPRLWTDSRYWLQATEQLAGTPIILMREGEDADVNPWLRTLPPCTIAAIASMMTQELYAEFFLEGLKPVLITTNLPGKYREDPFDTLWTDRPVMPLSPLEVVSDNIAGESAESKLQRLRDYELRKHTEMYNREAEEDDDDEVILPCCGEKPKPEDWEVFITDLSEISWLLNIRAADIPCNPYPLCFLSLNQCGGTLYIDARQVTDEARVHLDRLGIGLSDYKSGLSKHEQGVQGMLFVSQKTWKAPSVSVIAKWRAQKNPVEQEGFRQAHIRDGVAMVRFLAWLDQRSAEGFRERVTEIDVDRVLTAFRAEQTGYCGLSFETIAAYGPHGAIVHYEATPESDVPLEPRSLLLLDSGAHYDCGTTDITRTIALGPLTDEERRVYTLVLKGHLQLAHLHFPDGTTGLQLDTAARMAMWREGYDFGHGTGHGVGHRLGVHEGPVQIRKNLRGCTTLPFHAGQNITDEPGIYVPGRFGVRIENLLFAVEDCTTYFGHFLRFESVTLCPYDLRPIIVDMLTPEERRWLNDYHRHVREVLTPLLPTDDERRWLQQATRPI